MLCAKGKLALSHIAQASKNGFFVMEDEMDVNKEVKFIFPGAFISFMTLAVPGVDGESVYFSMGPNGDEQMETDIGMTREEAIAILKSALALMKE